MKKKVMLDWLTAGNVSIPKILLMNYHALGLSEEEVMTLIQVQAFLEDGYVFPTPNDIASRMSINEDKVMTVLQQLLKKNFLQLNDRQDSNGAMGESYSLEPLWERLINHLHLTEEKEMVEQKQEKEKDLYTLFEQEFSRPLSPMECETLAMWLDQDSYSVTLIHAALREAVVSGKLNLRYIDRILFEWSKNGVRTVEQARQYGEKFRKHQTPKSQTHSPKESQPKFPMYNWLEK